MISQTLEYALRAMGHLAGLGGGAASCRLISQATHIPHSYLAKVLRDLVRADLVRSTRGRGGGFSLSRVPTGISVLDIVQAVDPLRRIEACPIGRPDHVRLCPLHRCIDDALGSVQQRFVSATLGDLLEQPAAVPRPQSADQPPNHDEPR